MFGVKKDKRRRVLSLCLKLPFRLVGYLFLLVYILVALLNSTLVQSFTAAKVAGHFSKEWKTKLSIGALEIRPLFTVSLKDVYLEDREGNVIVDADYISVSLRSFSPPKKLVVSNVNLQDVTYVFAKKNGKLNLAFILDYFKSNKPKKDKPKGEPFVLKVERLRMKNVNFRLDMYDNPKPIPEFGVATNHLAFGNTDALISDVEIISDSITATFGRFSTTERCGQRVKDLSGKFIVSPRGITCSNMHVETENSDLKMQVGIKTEGWGTYSHFVDSAHCFLATASGSRVSMKDVTYWVPSLQGFDMSFDVHTRIEGKVCDAVCDFLKINTGKTHIALKGSVKGLPDVDNTVFDISLERLESSAKEFNEFKLGKKLSGLKLPTMLYPLGQIKIKADFRGLLTSFKANADIKTDIGNVVLSGSSKPAAKGRTSYACSLQSGRFNLGRLLGQDMLGTTAVDVSFEAVPADLKGLSAEVEAKLDGFEFNGNRYNSVSLDGYMAEGKFSAQCNIIDDAVVADLNCDGDLVENKRLKVRADITDADLKKMNLFAFPDTTAVLSTSLYADIRSFNTDSINGFVDLQNVKVSTREKNYAVEYLYLNVKNDSTVNRITLKSSLADLRLEGRYEISALVKEIGDLVNYYTPDLSLLTTSETPLQAMETTKSHLNISSVADFDLKLKDISPVTELLNLDMALQDGLSLTGRISPDTALVADLKAGGFRYGKMVFDNIGLNARASDTGISVDTYSDKAQLSDSFAIVSPGVNINLSGNDMMILAIFKGDEKNDIGGRLKLMSYLGNNGLQVDFKDSYVMLGKDTILFDNNSSIGYKDGRFELNRFGFGKRNEKIVITGAVSDNGRDRLKIAFQEVNIADFNPILNKFGLDVRGKLNNDVVLWSVLKDLSVESSINVDDLLINDVRLGKTKLGLSNREERNEFLADIEMKYELPGSKEVVPMRIKGKIDPYDSIDNLDLKISMQDFDIKLIETYLSSFFSDVRGKLSTESLAVRGRFSQPHVVGKLKFKDTSIKINMLNTVYSFDNELQMNDSVFSFDNFTLQDVNKNKITINGTVSHDNFSSFVLNLDAKADKLKMLDTYRDAGQMYYGTVYASADAVLTGSLDSLQIRVDATTEDNTRLTVPISSKMSANDNSFITFTSLQTENEETEEEKKPVESSMYYNIDVNLKVNPNAELYIPIDFNQIKGKLSAAGNGELNIKVGSESDLSIDGTVAIDNGKFSMSIADLVTKDFTMEKGGTLAWAGDPAGGVIDLNAVYSTTASLAPILGQEYSKKVDVNSIIHLSGEMTNPQPKFSIELPKVDESTKQYFASAIDLDDERTVLEQTFSLLVINSFYSSDGSAENSVVETGVSSALEAAFSQVSGMLTNLIKFVDVDMNYSRGASGNSDRIDMTLSKEYGRFIVSANAGFSGNSQTDVQQEEEIIGDAFVEYKMTEDFRVRVFNRSNANDFTKYNISPYTQGVGLFYHKQYDRFSDIFKRNRKHKNKDTK